MFGNKSLSLGRIYDTVKITEGGVTMKLHVNADPNRIVIGLNEAQKRLTSIDENTTDEEKADIARFFASVIFGDEQTQKLFDFYYGDPMCVISIASKYFAERLGKIILKAQKKSK